MRFELEKTFNPAQRRDSHGRWTAGGAGVGTQNYPAQRTATIQRLSPQEFHAMKPEKLQRTIKSALASQGGNTLNGIYAHIALAYGQAPGEQFAKKVDEQLKYMAKRGQLEVKLETIAQRHKKDVDSMTRSGKLLANTPKWKFDEVDGLWKIKEIEAYTINFKGHNDAKPLPVPPHTLGVVRPDRFQPELSGLANQALLQRRKTYPDTKMSPMGRYFSGHRDETGRPIAPELMYGDSPTDAKKYNRNEYFDKKHGIGFFDATSSVTAHVGAMTGNLRSLQDAKLIARASGDLPQHHELAQKLGIKAKDTTKPYFASLSGSNPANRLTPEDFRGLKTDGHAIKEVAKTIWTPSSYGSPLGKATTRAMDALRKGGMTDEALIKSTAQKLTRNFKETAMYNFTPDFKSIIREAPVNFVYTNPMSGFKMSFNEFKTKRHEVILDGKRVSTNIPTTISKDKSGNQKFGSAAPLFIQNWDAAVIGHLMKEMNSPHTAHDAIGVKKSEQAKLNTAVVKAMNMVKNHNPIKDLANQILRQHLKNGMSREEYRKLRARLLGKVVKMTHGRSQISDFVVNPDVGNNHFQPEF